VNAQGERARRFLALHERGEPLLLANAWDVGSARLLASLGFDALATTSSGFAATLGRVDGQVSREEALEHCASIVAASELPVSADLENGFADDPGGVAVSVRLALETGLAGCSIEDFSGRDDAPIYELGLAAERVGAAAEAAHGGPVHLVLTARAENHLHGRRDLADTIARLQAYERAGADVLFAPGVRRRRGHSPPRLGGRAARQCPRDARRAIGLRAGWRRREPDLGRRGLRLRGSRRCRGSCAGAVR
jgi:2-methylisocitrate lyase-like PEP mutase family enzyme